MDRNSFAVYSSQEQVGSFVLNPTNIFYCCLMYAVIFSWLFCHNIQNVLYIYFDEWFCFQMP